MYEMVPLTGLEPVRYYYQGILSPSCLPIPSQRHVYYSSFLYVKCTMKLPTSTIDIDEIMLIINIIIILASITINIDEIMLIINIINNIIILSFPFIVLVLLTGLEPVRIAS